MNTEAANAAIAAKDKAQYDSSVKRLLAQKRILAHILVHTIDKFKDIAPEEAEKYIEGEPYIGSVPTEPGLTNIVETDEEGHRSVVLNTGDGASGQRIAGLNTESAEVNEGLARFDIIFYVRTRNGRAQVIVNIEAQKDQPKDYSILNRAIFYVSRMVSSQKERDFVGSNYDDIKQVFSIWICMNMDENILSYIHLVKDEKLNLFDWKGNLNLLNIVMIGVTNEIPEQDKKYELHRLISALLSDDLQVKSKLAILEDEYNIPINRDFREEVNTMCNLAEGIEERAIERTQKATSEKFIMSMYKQGCSLNLIANVAGISKDEVEAVIKKKTTKA